MLHPFIHRVAWLHNTDSPRNIGATGATGQPAPKEGDVINCESSVCPAPCPVGQWPSYTKDMYGCKVCKCVNPCELCYRQALKCLVVEGQCSNEFLPCVPIATCHG